MRAADPGRRAQPHLRASLRRSPGDRRARAPSRWKCWRTRRPRHAGDPDRRRRADRRQRHRGARAVSPRSRSSASRRRFIPRSGTRSAGEDRPFGGPTLAEGIAVKNVGALTLPIVRELVTEIMLVDEAHLERAVNAYLTLQKTMAEGAGAAGLARHAGQAGPVPRPQGRADPVRRQHRPAHSRLDHGARARARGPHRLLPPDHSRPARRARADRHPARATSAPISSRSSIGGCSSMCRPRAPSST